MAHCHGNVFANWESLGKIHAGDDCLRGSRRQHQQPRASSHPLHHSILLTAGQETPVENELSVRVPCQVQGMIRLAVLPSAPRRCVLRVGLLDLHLHKAQVD